MRFGKLRDHAFERVLRLEHRVPDRPVHQRRVGRLAALAARSASASPSTGRACDSTSPSRADSFSLRFSAPPSVPIDDVGEERERRREARQLLVVAARFGRDVARHARRNASRSAPMHERAHEVATARSADGRTAPRRNRAAPCCDRARCVAAISRSTYGWQRIAPWPKMIRLRVRMFAPSTVIDTGICM